MSELDDALALGAHVPVDPSDYFFATKPIALSFSDEAASDSVEYVRMDAYEAAVATLLAASVVIVNADDDSARADFMVHWGLWEAISREVEASRLPEPKEQGFGTAEHSGDASPRVRE